MAWAYRFLTQWLPSAVYVVLYVVLDILIAHEGYTDPVTGKKAYHYTPGVLILLAEAGKLLIMLVLLMWERCHVRPNPKKDKYHAYVSVEDASLTHPGPDAGGYDEESVRLDWSVGVWYIVPAILYTSWNYLNYQSLLHVPLSVYSIIYQSVLFFSALLWSVVFKRAITPTQWGALILLGLGVFIIHFDPNGNFELSFDMNVFWVLAQAFVSAIGGVYNEFLYKRPSEVKLNISVQNTFLYTFTCLFTALYMLATEDVEVFKAENFFRGFTVRVVVIVITTVFLGISVSLILKHRDLIVKLYAQAIHSPVEIVAAHFVLGTALTWMIGVASGLIAVSTYLFYRPVQKGTNFAALRAGEYKPADIVTEVELPAGANRPNSLWERSRTAWRLTH